MPSQQRGFTLIEMLVVVTIVVILIVVALPSLTRNMPRRKVEDYTLRLMGHLRWAAHRAASSGEEWHQQSSSHSPWVGRVRIWCWR